MMTWIQKLACTLALFGVLSFPALGNEVSTAKGRLSRQIHLIGKISDYVDRVDLARLTYLKNTGQKVLDTIEEKGGIGNLAVMREYQILIISYRYSEDFFKFIATERTKKQIADLVKIYTEIAEARGFDDAPYTKITLSVFQQVKILLDELAQMPVGDELKEKMRGLLPLLGHTIARAEEKGDRRSIYELSVPLSKQITVLYPLFDQVGASSAAFEVVLSIQGLNEFYSEFAEIDTRESR
jgi:hypothetical protein